MEPLEIMDRCRKCKHFRKFKYKLDGEWQYMHCCTALVEMHPNDPNAFVLKVNEYDFCEMFEAKDEKDRV